VRSARKLKRRKARRKAHSLAKIVFGLDVLELRCRRAEDDAGGLRRWGFSARRLGGGRRWKTHDAEDGVAPALIAQAGVNHLVLFDGLDPDGVGESGKAVSLEHIARPGARLARSAGVAQAE
jgi:hypothetical protein